MSTTQTVINIKFTTIELRDGNNNFIAIKIGPGNLTYAEKRKRDYIMDRGLLDTVRDGDDEPMDVRLEFEWIHLTAASGDTAPTIEDALKQRGPASTWVSSSSNVCEPYALDIVLKDLPCSADTPETIILPDFRYEDLGHDLKASNISLTGKCNAVQATVNRGALQSY